MPIAPPRTLLRWKPGAPIRLIAALAWWHPAMLASMTGMPADAAHAAHAAPGTHAAHHHGTPQHHGLPFHCCTLCPLACAGTAAVPSAPLSTAAPALGRTHRSPGRRTTSRAPVTQHRLPFPLGPPPLRIA